MAIKFTVQTQRIRAAVERHAVAMRVNEAVALYPAQNFYEGVYTIIPALDAQTLATKDKIMRDDVSVGGIPYHEISNAADGMTAIIGGTGIGLQ